MAPGRHAASAWYEYLLAAGAVAAAMAVRYLLNPILGQQGPYLVVTLAIVVAALRGGFGPALFATVLGALIGTWLFMSDGREQLLLPANIARTVLFLAIGLSISVVGGRLRQSQHALAASVRQLRAGNNIKDSALAMLAHEIRNPLAALRSAGEVLKLAPDNPQRVLWASDLIGRQVVQMARMADDLLDVSSLMRRDVSIDKQRVDLRKVLQQALEQSGPLIARKQHVLRTDLGDSPSEVLGDPNRLIQIFANLLNNAAKYTPAGGEVSLTLRRGEPGTAVVSVSDSGVGMEPESIAELFEPFVQAPGAASNDEAGLGLGLAIVKRLVELHGGQIRAESAGLHRGSTFTVSLPLAF